MDKVIIQSPTRVDLAGGTLDMWPLFNFVGSAVTVNVAIDVYSQVEMEKRTDSTINIESLDLNYRKSFSNLKEFYACADSELSFYKPVVSFFNPATGFSIKTKSQSPVGAGLGGSSSLLISTLKAFYKLCDQKIPSSHQMVHIAHNIEAQMLNTPTGTQDYYPTYSGGLNILNYSAQGITQEVLKVSSSPLKENFLLVYTGRSHHSGINNFEVLKSAVSKDRSTLSTLQSLKEVSQETAEVCKKGLWSEVPRLFNLEYKYRVQLTPAFSSPEIVKLKQITESTGGKAIKICGAGGGGCVLIWTEESVRSNMIKECQNQGFQILNSRPVDPIQDQA